MLKDAEETLDGYTPMDSVEIDKSSYQPTQNYGAEEVSPQVSIAMRQEETILTPSVKNLLRDMV